MSKLLRNEISRLEKQMLVLSTLAEENLHKALKALQNRDITLAKEVIEGDAEVDRQEVELEEECLKILALHQPVAIDLRFIVAVLKINNDLERVADLAVNIADRVLTLADFQEVEIPFDVHEMAKHAWSMIHWSLDACVSMDAVLARKVLAADKEVDDMNRANFARIQDAIQQNVQLLPAYIAYLSVSRNLERVADHATNIAEDVIYMLEGGIIRHDKERMKGS